MAATKAKSKKAPHGTGICEYGYKLIREGKTNDEVLTAIHKKFAGVTQLQIGGVGWMRNKLRREDKTIKTNGEIKAERAAKKSKKAA